VLFGRCLITIDITAAQQVRSTQIVSTGQPPG
jgi:hypothetical protein